MTHPIVERIAAQLGMETVGADGFAPGVARHGLEVLFFCGDAARIPESQDVAVILPELLAALRTALVPRRVAPADERALEARFGVGAKPALVFLRDGAYLGAIEKMQDWAVYLQQVPGILAAEPSQPPSLNFNLAFVPRAVSRDSQTQERA